jgi:hypothetical protein
MELLSFVGLITILFSLGFGVYWLYNNVKVKNPIKSYIRKEVMNYLKELQDGDTV